MQRQAFTLIELSIVLVIIGLIVGGVLVGKDLIVSAGLRSQVSQIEQIQTSVQSFRLKYNSLPGDISSAKAAQFGFIPRAGTLGLGDENGMIRRPSGAGQDFFCGEIYLFWHDLSQAGLIAKTFSGMNTSGVCQAAATSNDVQNVLLPTKFNGGVVFVTSSESWTLLPGILQPSQNYMILAGTPGAVSNVGNPDWYSGSPWPYLTPEQAFYIDTKIDDGAASTGRARATGRSLISDAATANCTASGNYNISLKSDVCDMIIVAGF